MQDQTLLRIAVYTTFALFMGGWYLIIKLSQKK